MVSAMSRSARKVDLATEVIAQELNRVSGEMMLKHAASVFADRSNQYGEPRKFFEALTKRWSLTLGHSVTPDQVVRCLIDLKLTRLDNNPKHQDSIMDLAGYAAVLHEVIPRRSRAFNVKSILTSETFFAETFSGDTHSPAIG